MADTSRLAKSFKDYNDSIETKVGNQFSFSAFINKTKQNNIVASGLKENFFLEEIDFPWLDELELVTEKIMSIATKPRTHIKVEKDVKKAEQAVKIDNSDVIATLKVPAYWKSKGDRFLPEKVYTDIFEIEYAIYENRFIINLVDKMMLFLSQTISQLYSLIKNISNRFTDSHISYSDIEIIQDLSNFETFKFVPVNSKRSKRIKDNDATLLTVKDSPYVEALRRILQARNEVGHVRSTPFYKDVKKAKPLSDTDVHLTNMLAGDSNYAPCYNFYRKLLPMLSSNIEQTGDLDPKAYHNYVMGNLFAAFADLGFEDANFKVNAIKYNNNGLMVLEEYRLRKQDINVFITSKDEDHVDLRFELAGERVDLKATNNLELKKVNKVSLDLIPSTTPEYPSAEELSEYFKSKIKYRIQKGYTNAFVITAVDHTQKDDVIICSSETYKIDANIKDMIDSCIIFAEGDNFIYSHVCPVCGFYVDGEQEDGNCYCANCDSAYTLLVSGKDKQTKESVWIKRLKNPEKI